MILTSGVHPYLAGTIWLARMGKVINPTTTHMYITRKGPIKNVLLCNCQPTHKVLACQTWRILREVGRQGDHGQCRTHQQVLKWHKMWQDVIITFPHKLKEDTNQHYFTKPFAKQITT